MELYELIRKIYLDIRKELQLDEQFDPTFISTSQGTTYSFKRAVIESQAHGGYHLIKKGTLQTINTPQGPAINDQTKSHGWSDAIQTAWWQC